MKGLQGSRNWMGIMIGTMLGLENCDVMDWIEAINKSVLEAVYRGEVLRRRDSTGEIPVSDCLSLLRATIGI